MLRGVFSQYFFISIILPEKYNILLFAAALKGTGKLSSNSKTVLPPKKLSLKPRATAAKKLQLVKPLTTQPIKFNAPKVQIPKSKAPVKGLAQSKLVLMKPVKTGRSVIFSATQTQKCIVFHAASYNFLKHLLQKIFKKICSFYYHSSLVQEWKIKSEPVILGKLLPRKTILSLEILFE